MGTPATTRCAGPPAPRPRAGVARRREHALRALPPQPSFDVWLMAVWLGPVASLVGCYVSGNPAGDGDGQEVNEEHDEFALPPSCAVDLLLVLYPNIVGSVWRCSIVDPECRLDTFEALDATLAAGGASSYHVGAVYGKGSHSWFGPEHGCWSYEEMASGELVRLDDPVWGCAGSPTGPWTEGPGGAAAQTMSECLTVFGIQGEGVRDGACYPVVESMRAVQNALSPEMTSGPNAGMFRENARLVIAFLGPKDDCSVEDPYVYASFGDWPSTCGVDPIWESWLLNVEGFASYLERVGGDRVSVAVWAGPDGVPTEVVEPDGRRHPVYLCQLGEGVGVPVAPRFHRLLRAFGERALFRNACETPLSEFYGDLADFIVAQLPADCGAGAP